MIKKTSVNNIKLSIHKNEKELNNINKNIIDINAKLKYLNSILKKSEQIKNNVINIKNTFYKNKSEPNKLKIKSANFFRTNYLDNNNLNLSTYTFENFYKNKLVENDSDENSRNIINEKNKIFNKQKKNYKKIDIDNNIKPKFYDFSIYFYKRNNNSLNVQRFHSPQNRLPNSKNKFRAKKKVNNKILKDKENNNLEKDIKVNENHNLEKDNNNHLKDLFLLKCNKIKFLKEKDFSQQKSDNLENNIMNSIKNLMNENKFLRNKENLNKINNINITFSPNKGKYIKLNEIDNNEIYSKKNKIINNSINDNNRINLNNKNKKNREYLSPDLDKLYKEYYYKNKIKEEKKQNNNIKILPKKIISVFGRTTYSIIKDRKKSNSESFI